MITIRGTSRPTEIPTAETIVLDPVASLTFNNNPDGEYLFRRLIQLRFFSLLFLRA